YKAKPPMSGELAIAFPPPVGTCKAILTLHSEVLTLATSYADKGIKHVTFRLGLPTEFHDKLKLLVDLGLGSPDKLTVDGASIVPRKLLAKLLERFPAPQQEPDDAEVVRVDVRGLKGTRDQIVRLETIVRAHKEWKMSCGAVDTGVPPSIVAQMILNGEIKEYGVLAPEQCVPIQKLFDELAKRCIIITTEVMESPAAALRH
ncbi:MAG: saccharopine dehydrogenase family protein, partial [Terriglobales bacterium]